jgi:hypothetical protein
MRLEDLADGFRWQGDGVAAAHAFALAVSRRDNPRLRHLRLSGKTAEIKTGGEFL